MEKLYSARRPLKKLFPGHYRPSDDEFKSLWTKGLFVFDTNVLLNLYSYPEKARDIFFSVLNRVVDRTWIPYQVALEFHNNRFNRIQKSNDRLLNLHARIQENSTELEAEFARIEFDKRNTGIVDLHDRLAAVREANKKLAEAVDLACKRLPSLSLDDPIGARIAELLDGKVGDPPADQEALDALVKDGEERYEKKIPPGFKDGKEKREMKYRDRGLTYMAKFGDLILWRQTIAHVSQSGQKDVIFITGDGKEDWWSSLEGKTLGPAPELIQEFLSKTGAERFWMYSADQFLANAEEYLQAQEVTPETIEQVKETADSQQNHASRSIAAWEAAKEMLSLGTSHEATDPYEKYGWMVTGSENAKLNRDEHTWSAIESAVSRWAKSRSRAGVVVPVKHMDFAILSERSFHGYSIVEHRGLNRRLLRNSIKAVASATKELALDRASIVVALTVDEFREADDIALELYASDAAHVLSETTIHSVEIGYVDGREFFSLFSIEGPKG